MKSTATALAIALLAGTAQATDWSMDSDGYLIGDNGGAHTIFIGCDYTGRFGRLGIQKEGFRDRPEDFRMTVDIDGERLADVAGSGYPVGAVADFGPYDNRELFGVLQRILLDSGQMTVDYAGVVEGQTCQDEETVALAGAAEPLRGLLERCAGLKAQMEQN